MERKKFRKEQQKGENNFSNQQRSSDFFNKPVLPREIVVYLSNLAEHFQTETDNDVKGLFDF